MLGGLKLAAATGILGFATTIGSGLFFHHSGKVAGIEKERGVWSQRVLAGELLKKEQHNALIKEANDHNAKIAKELVEEKQRNADANEEFRGERQDYLNHIRDLSKKVGVYVPNTCKDDGTYGFSYEFITGVFNPIAEGGRTPGPSPVRTTQEVGAAPGYSPLLVSPIVRTKPANSASPSAR